MYKMKSCTIIISHFESLVFLRTCIRQTRRYANENIHQHIIICDQSSDNTYYDVLAEYEGDEDITVVHTSPLYSGYGLDWIFRNVEIKTDYVAQIHVDAFSISDKWLLMPIKLIEECTLDFVGQLQFINGKNNLAHIYPPDPFFAMAQCYNVAPTHVYRELAMIPGFTRFHNRPLARQEGMEWSAFDWDRWAAHDYQARGSDDDVVAFHWQDKHKQVDKLGLAITGYIEPSYGRIIESVVFHFGSHREALSVLESMPKMYSYYLNKINLDYSDELIDEMVELAKKNRPPSLEILTRNYWNGTTKESSATSKELNKRIEELKY